MHTSLRRSSTPHSSGESIVDSTHLALAIAILSPLVVAVIVGARVLLIGEWPSERSVSAPVRLGLGISLLASVVVMLTFAGALGVPVRGEVELGNWIRIGGYEIPAVFFSTGCQSHSHSSAPR